MPGENAFRDMAERCGERPVIFDVGANTGQTLARIYKAMPNAVVHAFEPHPPTYEKLVHNIQACHYPSVIAHNLAMGGYPGTTTLHCNVKTDLGSLLLPVEPRWGELNGEVEVEMETVDRMMEAAGIKELDVLKTDTQGYEIMVLRGAVHALADHRIRMVYVEVNFQPFYVGQSSWFEISSFMSILGYTHLCFYTQHTRHGRLGWTDAMFLSREFAE